MTFLSGGKPLDIIYVGSGVTKHCKEEFAVRQPVIGFHRIDGVTGIFSECVAAPHMPALATEPSYSKMMAASTEYKYARLE